MSNVPAAPAGAAFDFGGKSYFLPRVNDRVREVAEAHFGAQALARVRRMSAAQTPEENARDYDEALQRVMAGKLAWDEPGGIASLYTVAGLTLVCFLCLRDKDPDATLTSVQAIAKPDGGRFLLEQYQKANADPLAVPPNASPAGGGSSGPGSPSSGDSASPTSAT